MNFRFAAIALLLALILTCFGPSNLFAGSVEQGSAAPAAHIQTRPEAVIDVPAENFSRDPALRPAVSPAILALLNKADEYFQAGRVADPPGDSAYGLYLFVLGMDPQNEAAQMGIRAVGNHFLALGRRQLQDENYAWAEQSFRKALLVNADDRDAELGLSEAERFAKKPALAKKLHENATPPANAPTAAAPLDQAAIDAFKAAVHRNMGKVKFCFAKNPDAKGVASIRFVLNPDGSVSNVAVPDSTIGDPEIDQCLARRVALMQFQAFAGPARTVVIPFRFNQ